MGRGVSALRNFLVWMMIVVCPPFLLAADTGSAILHSKGGVWVNGSEVVDATSIFKGDVLETKPGFVANLDTEGSSVLIQPESIVKFEGTFLSLEHGSVAVGTSTALSVHVNCIRVEPISNNRTQYEVTDLTGSLEVAARKNDVNIKQAGKVRKASANGSSSQEATVHEGEQAKRDEAAACGAVGKLPLNPKLIEAGSAVGGGALALCLLLCKGSTNPNVSQDDP